MNTTAPQPDELDVHDTSLRGVEREAIEVKLQQDEPTTAEGAGT